MDYEYMGYYASAGTILGSFGQVRCVSVELMGAAKMAHWPKLVLWNMNGSCSFACERKQRLLFDGSGSKILCIF